MARSHIKLSQSETSHSDPNGPLKTKKKTHEKKCKDINKSIENIIRTIEDGDPKAVVFDEKEVIFNEIKTILRDRDSNNIKELINTVVKNKPLLFWYFESNLTLEKKINLLEAIISCRCQPVIDNFIDAKIGNENALYFYLTPRPENKEAAFDLRFQRIISARMDDNTKKSLLSKTITTHGNPSAFLDTIKISKECVGLLAKLKKISLSPHTSVETSFVPISSKEPSKQDFLKKILEQQGTNADELSSKLKSKSNLKKRDLTLAEERTPKIAKTVKIVDGVEFTTLPASALATAEATANTQSFFSTHTIELQSSGVPTTATEAGPPEPVDNYPKAP